MITLISIGECMVELSAAGPDLMARRFAGDAYNTAVYFKRSAPAATVKFLTALGDDPFSLAMRRAFDEAGIDDSMAFTVPGQKPAVYVIETDASGDRRFHYWRSESAARRWFKTLQAAGGGARLQGADMVYISGISLAILAEPDRVQAVQMLRAFAGDGGRIAFDPNLRPALWPSIAAARAVFEALAAVAAILLPSRQDLEALYGVGDPAAQMAILIGLGAREAALTAEGEDALVFDGRVQALTPPPAKVFDTSGGGDSFNGAYLAARLCGAQPLEATRRGLALAARVVERPGALVPGLPAP